MLRWVSSLTKLDNTGSSWHGSEMVQMLIIHALAISVYCVLHGVLVEEWFRGGHTCSLHVMYNI